MDFARSARNHYSAFHSETSENYSGGLMSFETDNSSVYQRTETKEGRRKHSDGIAISYRLSLLTSPGDLLDPWIEAMSFEAPALRVDSLLLSHWGSPFSISSHNNSDPLQGKNQGCLGVDLFKI